MTEPKQPTRLDRLRAQRKENLAKGVIYTRKEQAECLAQYRKAKKALEDYTKQEVKLLDDVENAIEQIVLIHGARRLTIDGVTLEPWSRRDRLYFREAADALELK